MTVWGERKSVIVREQDCEERERERAWLGRLPGVRYESPEGTWGFSKKAISKSLYRIVQSVLMDK